MTDQRETKAREHTYKIRLSDAEKRKLDQLAGEHDMSIANLIRAVVLGSGYVHQSKLPSSKVLKKSMSAIVNIASNINQAVTAVNTAAKSGKLSNAEPSAVVDALRDSQAVVLHSATLIRDELQKFRLHRGFKS